MYDQTYQEKSELPTNQQAQPAAPSEDIIDLRALGLVLLRRKWIIINTILFCTILTVLILFQLTPRYTASVMLALETRQNQVVDMQAVVSGISADAATIKTEIDVMTSRRLVGKTVDTLNLVRDPELNTELQTNKGFLSYLNPVNWLPDSFKAAIFGEQEVLSVEEQQSQERARVIDAVTERLSVSNPPRSYSISVSFESDGPRKAARIANGLADLYLTDQLEAKFEATQRANDWLN